MREWEKAKREQWGGVVVVCAGSQSNTQRFNVCTYACVDRGLKEDSDRGAAQRILEKIKVKDECEERAP